MGSSKGERMTTMRLGVWLRLRATGSGWGAKGASRSVARGGCGCTGIGSVTMVSSAVGWIVCSCGPAGVAVGMVACGRRAAAHWSGQRASAFEWPLETKGRWADEENAVAVIDGRETSGK
jgi:hypothetical protein